MKTGDGAKPCSDPAVRRKIWSELPGENMIGRTVWNWSFVWRGLLAGGIWVLFAVLHRGLGVFALRSTWFTVAVLQTSSSHSICGDEFSFIVSHLASCNSLTRYFLMSSLNL